MKMNRRFVVLGQDARMQAAAAALAEAGCTLLDPVWTEQADCVVLPVRLEERSPELALALALARLDARLLGGAERRRRKASIAQLSLLINRKICDRMGETLQRDEDAPC